MSTKRKPILAGAVFCSSASESESGSVNCSGIFTSFLAWAYPTSLRSWHAILMLHGLREGTTSVTAAISLGRGSKTTLVSADIERGKEDVGNVLTLPLRHKFTREGLHTVYFTVVGTTTVLKVPLNVATQRWPTFTKKQLEVLRKNRSIPHSIRMNIMCSKCSSAYIFEESVLPDEVLAGNVLPFPESGVLECESCGHELHLKDYQGQLRSSIKTAVLGAIRGGK